MEVGVHVPQWGEAATRDGVLAVARAAEDAGLASVWVADHVVHPHSSLTAYPYRAKGLPWSAGDGFLDGLTTLAVIAGATSRIRIGTSVFILPMRGPLEVTKTVATLDVLSGGRVILGIGAGWWQEEFDALGATFAKRGARMDEQLEIMRKLWRDGSLEHHGDHYSFDELSCRPLPLQTGGPPVWIGGMGATGQKRAARCGDGWHAVSSDASALREGYGQVRALAAEYGRDPDAVGLSTSAGLPPDRERAVSRLVALAGAGVDHVVLNIAATTVAETCAAIDDLAANILPSALREIAVSPIS